VGHVVTLTGILRGMLFFGERLDPAIWLATAVLLAGIALVNLGGNGARKT
jgi:drug/metabolite transporter (DMT)-like permease